MPLVTGTLTQTGSLIGEPIKSPVLMSRRTGGKLYDTDHIVQGITDILTTRKGSRVLLREYGSDLFDLLDRPVNAYLIARVYAAVIIAINRWEKRVRITKVSGLDLTKLSAGHIEMDLYGYYRASHRPLHLSAVSLDFYGENRYELNLENSTPA